MVSASLREGGKGYLENRAGLGSAPTDLVSRQCTGEDRAGLGPAPTDLGFAPAENRLNPFDFLTKIMFKQIIITPLTRRSQRTITSITGFMVQNRQLTPHGGF